MIIGNSDIPISILISGVYGVGKTTLSYNLSKKLGIKQRSSVGLITKTLQLLRGNDHAIKTIDKVEKEDDRFKNFDQQSREVCSVVNYVLEISRSDGVDYILDGVQLTPKYLNIDKYALFLFLKIPPVDIYLKRLNNSKSHSLRDKNVSRDQAMKMSELESHILQDVRLRENIKIIDGSIPEDKVTAEAISIVRDWMFNLR